MMAERMDLWRLREFALERLPVGARTSTCSAPRRATNPRDERLVALAEVRDLTPVRDEHGRITALPELERMVREAFEAMRSVQSRRPPRERLHWNRLLLYAWPTIDFAPDEASAVITPLRAHDAPGSGSRWSSCGAHARGRRERDRVLRIFNPAGRGVAVELGDPPTQPLQPLDEGAQRIVSARRRGMRAPGRDRQAARPAAAQPARRSRPASSSSTTSTSDGRARPGRPARRPPTRASIVVGLIRNRTERHPEGMLRVVAARRPDARRSARWPSRSAGA